MQVNVVNKSNNQLPTYANTGDAGCDVRAELSTINTKFLFDSDVVIHDDNSISVVIAPGGRALIPTEIYTAIPEGYEIQIRPRSGSSLNHGIQVHIGTIDNPYRKSIGIIIYNFGKEHFIVNQGDRIAQFVLNKVEQIEWNSVESLDETERGDGFGSSGVK